MCIKQHAPFSKKSGTSSKAAVPFCIPTSNGKKLLLLHTLSSTGARRVLDLVILTTHSGVLLFSIKNICILILLSSKDYFQKSEMGTKFTHKECNMRNQIKVCIGTSLCPVVRSLPVYAVDTSLTPSAGRSHRPQDNWAQRPQGCNDRACSPELVLHSKTRLQEAHTLHLEQPPLTASGEKPTHSKEDPAQPK